MSATSKDFKTPNAIVRGKGPLREGLHHWWAQRLTSIALVPLTLWMVVSALYLTGADWNAYQAWVSEFGNLLMLILFFVAGFYHMALGLQVIVEDYVHSEAWKFFLIITIKFGSLMLGVACIIAALSVAFGG